MVHYGWVFLAIIIAGMLGFFVRGLFEAGRDCNTVEVVLPESPGIWTLKGPIDELFVRDWFDLVYETSGEEGMSKILYPMVKSLYRGRRTIHKCPDRNAKTGNLLDMKGEEAK